MRRKEVTPSVSAAEKPAVKRREWSTSVPASEPATGQAEAAAMKMPSESAPEPVGLATVVQEKKKAANEQEGSKKKVKRSPTQDKVNSPKL